MTLRSKTYSLDDRVHEALDRLKVLHGSYNKALFVLLVPDDNAPLEMGSERRETAAAEVQEVEDLRPKSATCRHCGGRFAGPVTASICPGCKSTGHTLAPAECPVCGESGTGAL